MLGCCSRATHATVDESRPPLTTTPMFVSRSRQSATASRIRSRSIRSPLHRKMRVRLSNTVIAIPSHGVIHSAREVGCCHPLEVEGGGCAVELHLRHVILARRNRLRPVVTVIAHRGPNRPVQLVNRKMLPRAHVVLA